MAGESVRADPDQQESSAEAARSVAPALHAVDDTDAGAAELPDAGETARALALCVVEILSGAREVDSIARWVTDDVHRHLQQRAAVTAQRRSALRRPPSRPSLRAGNVVTCSPAPDVVEATVVVYGRTKARAVAIRLEARNGRWRATAVGVL